MNITDLKKQENDTYSFRDIEDETLYYRCIDLRKPADFITDDQYKMIQREGETFTVDSCGISNPIFEITTEIGKASTICKDPVKRSNIKISIKKRLFRSKQWLITFKLAKGIDCSIDGSHITYENNPLYGDIIKTKYVLFHKPRADQFKGNIYFATRFHLV